MQPPLVSVAYLATICFFPGWADIGYNFLVGEDGHIYEGRGWETLGAHTGEWNPVSFGICVMGTFFDFAPNQLAIDAVKQLMQCGVDRVSTSRVVLMHWHK